MIRTMDELIKAVTSRIGEDTSDEALGLLEDVSDTLKDYETRLADTTNWQEKYKENDEEWRRKYKERFSAPAEGVDTTIYKSEEIEEKTYKYEDLFE